MYCNEDKYSKIQVFFVLFFMTIMVSACCYRPKGPAFLTAATFTPHQPRQTGIFVTLKTGRELPGISSASLYLDEEFVAYLPVRGSLALPTVPGTHIISIHCGQTSTLLRPLGRVFTIAPQQIRYFTATPMQQKKIYTERPVALMYCYHWLIQEATRGTSS